MNLKEIWMLHSPCMEDLDFVSDLFRSNQANLIYHEQIVGL